MKLNLTKAMTATPPDRRRPFVRHLAMIATLVGSLFVCTQALAIDYLIEVVLVENLRGANSSGNSSLYIARQKNSIGLKGEKAEELGFSLVEGPYALSDHAAKIKASGGFRLLRHFAWRQPGLSDRKARAVRINVGKGVPVYIPEQYREFDKFIPASTGPTFESGSRQLTTTTVNGWLKVRLGRFLHLDSNLVFTDLESRSSYRLEHSRKMRSRELHYIDNPRFGFLVRIVPIDE